MPNAHDIMSEQWRRMAKANPEISIPV